MDADVPGSPEDLGPRPADVVVFDLGNVLIQWDPVPAIASAVGTERAAAFLVGEISGTVAILRELHAAGVPQFALTNWSADLFPVAVERFEFLNLFEDIILSGEEGVAKPDPEIFEVLEERLRHRAGLDDCIFIDDSPPNVLAAEGTGMDAIHFTGPDDLREDLVARGMPLRPTR